MNCLKPYNIFYSQSLNENKRLICLSFSSLTAELFILFKAFVTSASLKHPHIVSIECVCECLKLSPDQVTHEKEVPLGSIKIYM